MKKITTTVWANLSEVFTQLGPPFTKLIPTAHEPDRVYGWEQDYGNSVYTFCQENWDIDPGFSTRIFHGISYGGYREPGGVIPCVQLCFHKDPGTSRIFWEGDLDYSSWRGVPGFLIHGLEFAYNMSTRQKTNQAFVAWLLKRRFKKGDSRKIYDEQQSSN